MKGTCVFVLRLQWGSQPEDFQSRGARSLRGTTRTPDRFLPVSRCRRFSPPLFPFLLDFLPTPRSVQPHVDRFTLSLPTASEGVQRRAQAEIVLECLNESKNIPEQSGAHGGLPQWSPHLREPSRNGRRARRLSATRRRRPCLLLRRDGSCPTSIPSVPIQ